MSPFIHFTVLIMSIILFSCGSPTETKEEFIQKGIIMSDTLLKSVDNQLKDAQMAVDSAIQLGLFIPPPASSTSQNTASSTANNDTSTTHGPTRQ